MCADDIHSCFVLFLKKNSLPFKNALQISMLLYIYGMISVHSLLVATIARLQVLSLLWRKLVLGSREMRRLQSRTQRSKYSYTSIKWSLQNYSFQLEPGQAELYMRSGYGPQRHIQGRWMTFSCWHTIPQRLKKMCLLPGSLFMLQPPKVILMTHLTRANLTYYHI